MSPERVMRFTSLHFASKVLHRRCLLAGLSSFGVGHRVTTLMLMLEGSQGCMHFLRGMRSDEINFFFLV